MTRLDSDSPQVLACGEFIVKSAKVGIWSKDMGVDEATRNA